MNIDDIRRARNASPFVSFTLGLGDGRKVFVAEPSLIALGKQVVVVAHLVTGSTTIMEAPDVETLVFDAPYELAPAPIQAG
jgi:hypothetical protein